MDRGSALILSNHSEYLLYLPGIVEHGWFMQGPSLFILRGVSSFFRQILGEFVQHLELLHIVWRRQNCRIGPSHRIACLYLSERFLQCVVQID